MADDYKYQLSRKTASGDLLNIRADSADEFRQAIDGLFGEGASAAEMAVFMLGATPVGSTAPAVSSTAPVSVPAAVTPGVPAGGLGLCPSSGHPLVLKQRKDGSGSFVACSGYPNCSYIQKD